MVKTRQETMRRKPNKTFLLLSFLSLLFLFPLFFFAKRSLDPTFSLYLNYQATSSSDNIRSDITYVVPNQTPLNTTNKHHTFPNNNADEHPTSLSQTLEESSLPRTGDEVSEEEDEKKDDIVVNKNADGHPTNPSLTLEVSRLGDEVFEEKEEKKDDIVVNKNADGDQTNPSSTLEVSTLPGSGDEDLEEKEKEKEKKEAELLRRCDLFDGKWVKDEEGNHPIYEPGTCPYIDEGFDCQRNGRPDFEYLKWRWKPHGCELPRFSSARFLERLRGKKLMLVGDSMNRNQFESLLCMLWEGLSNKSKMYETHGYKISKGRGYFVFKFEDYDCSVEFVRSHFLVKEGIRRISQGRTNPTLSIDRIDKTAKRWKKSDILVFNTGHWWTHGKTARGKNYYQEGSHIYPFFDAVEAFRRAIKTWAKWIDGNMSKKKLVIYRGYSSAHFRGGDWDSGGSCNGEKEPVTSGAILDSYPPKMKIVDEVMKEMKFPAVLLNVTKLTNFRKDGHPSIYGKALGKKVSRRRQDCSHWCLPGVPDAWNELVFTAMVIHQTPTV